ncbi:MAG: hypothetical protein HY693_00920 [Deltaproteobacteria bacterium]|nr:hypothetical protein [Deltaproteobacteria bacterium]
MKRIVLILIVLVVLIAFFLLPTEDDTREIESMFDEVMMAGRKKDLEGVMDHFSIHYRDENGATYPVVKNIIMNFFSNYDGFDCNYSDLKVSINDSDEEEMAVANLDFYVSGIKTGKSFPIIGNELLPENIIVTLEKTTLGAWKIKEVEGVRIDE